MIVADANLIFHYVVRGQFTEQAQAVFLKDRVWIAPTLWEAEILSAVCNEMRRGKIKREEAVLFILHARSLMRDQSHPIDFRRVLSVAEQTKCSGYDSQYISLAEQRGLKLVTCDNGILANAPHVAVSPEQFLAA